MFSIQIERRVPVEGELDQGKWHVVASDDSTELDIRDSGESMYVLDLTHLLDGLRALLSDKGTMLTFVFRTVGGQDFQLEFAKGTRDHILVDGVSIRSERVVEACLKLAEQVVADLQEADLDSGPAYMDLRDSVAEFREFWSDVL